MEQKNKIIKQICHDCGVEEGKLHLDGCDMEHCSKCGGQVLVDGICKGAKPEPYFQTCLSCVRCGITFPDFQMVSDEDWKEICGVTYELDAILCQKCMDFILKSRRKFK